MKQHQSSLPACTLATHRARTTIAAACLVRAFTFIEVMVVVIIIGVLAAMVVPQFSGVTEDAKSSAAEGAVAGVRSSIAGYRAKAIISGGPSFPTLIQLTTSGVVVQGELPLNPYNKLRNVQAVSTNAATARNVSNSATVGWNYFVDNSSGRARAVFYLNSSNTTTIPTGSVNTFKSANQL